MIVHYLIAANVCCGAAAEAGNELAWAMDAERAPTGFAAHSSGRPLQLSGEIAFGPAERGGGLIMDGRTTELVVAARADDVRGDLPARAFSVGAWVSIDMPLRWGGIVGCVRDDAEIEKGWVLGYDERRFTFGLSTISADDGDGRLTYVDAGNRGYEVGRWHHVVATYDGTVARLYVDGTLAGTSTEQSGDVLYDLDMPVVIGAYRDTNENHRHDGRVLEVELHGRALSADEVGAWYANRHELNALKPWRFRSAPVRSI